MAIDQSTELRLGRLRIWNIVVGFILAAQAVMMAVLTNNFSLPVTATFMSGPPGTPAELYHLFDIQTGWGVFTFLAISAAALLTIASPEHVSIVPRCHTKDIVSWRTTYRSLRFWCSPGRRHCEILTPIHCLVGENHYPSEQLSDYGSTCRLWNAENPISSELGCPGILVRL